MSDNEADAEDVPQYPMQFESLDDFKTYYKEHKKEIDSQTTLILNSRYKIKDYIIRKVHGVLGFRRHISEKIRTIKYERDTINKRLETLEKTVNDIITAFNQLSVGLP
jgi:uncharacterized coiled-coil DUF342 family protein